MWPVRHREDQQRPPVRARRGGEFEWEPAYSIAPTNSAPILRQHEGEREFEIAKWGFRPSWAKAGGPPRINARLETVATNGLFWGAFAGSRCIVPMSGYYEWEEVEDGKQPYFISSPRSRAGRSRAASGV